VKKEERKEETRKQNMKERKTPTGECPVASSATSVSSDPYVDERLRATKLRGFLVCVSRHSNADGEMNHADTPPHVAT
jgi:hypothetical protein